MEEQQQQQPDSFELSEINKGFAENTAKLINGEITIRESVKQYRVLNRQLRAEVKKQNEELKAARALLKKQRCQASDTRPCDGNPLECNGHQDKP